MEEYVRMGWFLVPQDLRQDPAHIGWLRPPVDMLLNHDNVRVGNFTLNRELWADPGSPRITSPTSASVQVNTPFSYQIAATNSPDSFTATPLPPGLSVNAAGLISGTPTVVGSTGVTITATNAIGTATRTLNLRVTAEPVAPPVALNAYYGPSNEWLIPPNPAALDEAYIKALTARSNPANGTVMAATISAPQGRSPIFAYPATLRAATSIIHEGLGMNVVGTFQQATIQVNGVDYRVYYQEAEFPVGQNTTFTMTI